jgi:Tol biopolymer transport system component
LGIPSWSPDRTGFVYAQFAPPDQQQIRYCRPGEESTLLGFGEMEQNPWSPDGSRIVYTHEDVAYVSNRAGTATTLPLNPAAQPSFLDNDNVVCVRARLGAGTYTGGPLYQITVSDGTLLDLSTLLANGWSFHCPRVSHDGTFIAVSRFDEITARSRFNDIFLLSRTLGPIDLGRINVNPSRVDVVQEMVFSADDRGLLIAIGGPTGFDNPYEVDIPGETIAEIPSIECSGRIRALDFAPDSANFVFEAQDGGIHLFDAGTKTATVLDAEGKEPDW